VTVISGAKENQVFEAAFRSVADKPIIDKLKEMYPTSGSEKYYQILDGQILELLKEDNSTITAVPKFSEGTSGLATKIRTVLLDLCVINYSFLACC
jgi:hypothetical protein